MNNVTVRRTQTVSRKRPGEILQNCLNRTVRLGMKEMPTILHDITKNTDILKSVDNITNYVKKANTSYQKGLKFELLNAVMLLNSSNNNETVAMTPGSHDHGADMIISSNGNTTFVQVKYRSTAKIGKGTALSVCATAYDTERFYMAKSVEEAKLAMSSTNGRNEKFVFITNAELTKGAAEIFNEYEWTVISAKNLAAYIENPMQFMRQL